MIEKGQTLSPLVLSVMLTQVQVSSGTREQHFNQRNQGFLQKVLMSVTDLSKGAVNSQHKLPKLPFPTGLKENLVGHWNESHFYPLLQELKGGAGTMPRGDELRVCMVWF